jgi:hypothetical protein
MTIPYTPGTSALVLIRCLIDTGLSGVRTTHGYKARLSPTTGKVCAFCEVYHHSPDQCWLTPACKV